MLTSQDTSHYFYQLHTHGISIYISLEFLLKIEDYVNDLRGAFTFSVLNSELDSNWGATSEKDGFRVKVLPSGVNFTEGLDVTLGLMNILKELDTFISQ